MKYRVNGQEVTPEEFRNRHQGSGHIAGILATRTAPGGHEPYWGGGHESISAGVPSSQAQERHDFLKSQGMTGYEILKDGTLKTSSPQNHAKCLKALGLADAGGAGSDARALKQSSKKRGT
jgi:hypothetical protein